MSKTKDETSWSELGRVYLFTVKKCRPHVTPDEFLVLMFVFERTYGYKKEWERIPLRHFLDGVFHGQTNECVTTRTGISKTNLLAALRHLTGKGLLLVSSDGKSGSNWYSVAKPEAVDWHRVISYLPENQGDALRRNTVVEAVWSGRDPVVA